MIPGLPMPAPPPRPSAAPSTESTTAIAADWTEHTAPDGRKYFFHKTRGVSSWEKPEELKTVQERAIQVSTSAWKEYVSSSGKKYYFNTTTRKTTWEIPDEMKTAAEKSSGEASIPKAPTNSLLSGNEASSRPKNADTVLPPQPSSEHQFMALLTSAGVQESMGWDD